MGGVWGVERGGHSGHFANLDLLPGLRRGEYAGVDDPRHRERASDDGADLRGEDQTHEQ